MNNILQFLVNRIDGGDQKGGRRTLNQLFAANHASQSEPSTNRKILIVGLPGAGKTTLALALAPMLKAVLFDADAVRANINCGLGYSLEDRIEHARRMGWLCDRVVEAGHTAIADFVCPTPETRAAYHQWRRKFLPVSKADLAWRHEFIAARLDSLEQKVSARSAEAMLSTERPNMASTKLDSGLIIACYKVLLGREPENTDVVSQKQSLKTYESLLIEFITSDEFSSKFVKLTPAYSAHKEGSSRNHDHVVYGQSHSESKVEDLLEHKIALDTEINNDYGECHILMHHKCATVWAHRYVNDYCVANALHMFATHYSNMIPNKRYDVTLLTNSSYCFLKHKIKHGVHIIRNPLDIIVSAYYSHKQTHPDEYWPRLASQRRLLRAASDHDGIFLTLSFLERDDFDANSVGPLHAIRHWDFDDRRFLTMRMEDVVREPTNTLGSYLRTRVSASRLPNESNHTFQAITSRALGEVDDKSHYRSGKPDQWRTVLPASVISYVRVHYEAILRRFYPDSLVD
jgi:predicted kinase